MAAADFDMLQGFRAAGPWPRASRRQNDGGESRLDVGIAAIAMTTARLAMPISGGQSGRFADRAFVRSCVWPMLEALTEDQTVLMYRPTGPEELSLVESSGFRAWPPRLPDQPIFYPVTNEAYAVEIARDWNVPASGYGCVTRFRVRAEFMSGFPIQQVGGAHHTEWWVPAERLDDLNRNIVGLIEVVREFGQRRT